VQGAIRRDGYRIVDAVGGKLTETDMVCNEQSADAARVRELEYVLRLIAETCVRIDIVPDRIIEIVLDRTQRAIG
jgi:hypothetical protein